MRRRARPLAAVAASAAALCILAATAQAVSQPAGTPNLAAMTVQPSDLAPDAMIGADGYATPPAGLAAAYERDYTRAQPPGGGRAFVLDTAIELAPTTARAQAIVAQDRRAFATTLSRSLLGRLVAAALGRGHLKVTRVRVSRIRALATGQGSFLDVLRVTAGRGSISADFVVVGQGPVAATLFVGTTGTTPPTAIAKALAVAVDGHIAAALAAFGSTGASGPTGAGGTTGASGPTGATGA